MKSKPVIILGAGGHSKVLIDLLKYYNITIIGITDPDSSLHGKSIMGVPVIGNDHLVLEYHPDTILLVNGIGLTAKQAGESKSSRPLKSRITVFSM